MPKKKRLAPVVPPADSKPAPYGGNDYRVRVMEVQLVVDVYTSSGELLGRVRDEKNVVAIPESEFPVDMCRLLQANTELKDGFYCLKDASKKIEPKP